MRAPKLVSGQRSVVSFERGSMTTWLCGRCEQIKAGQAVTLPEHHRLCPERFTRLNASDIASVEYLASRQELIIDFHGTGRYAYFAVPVEVHDGLIKSHSPGKFFLQNIKGKFAWGKVA